MFGRRQEKRTAFRQLPFFHQNHSSLFPVQNRQLQTQLPCRGHSDSEHGIHPRIWKRLNMIPERKNTESGIISQCRNIIHRISSFCFIIPYYCKERNEDSATQNTSSSNNTSQIRPRLLSPIQKRRILSAFETRAVGWSSSLLLRLPDILYFSRNGAADGQFKMISIGF